MNGLHMGMRGQAVGRSAEPTTNAFRLSGKAQRHPSRVLASLQSSLSATTHGKRVHLGTTLVAKAPRTCSVRVQAVFERFSDRSIQFVALSQQLAKKFGASEVNTEHLFLGLIAEDTLSRNGYMNSGLLLERAQAAVMELNVLNRQQRWQQMALGTPSVPSLSGDVMAFSKEVRRTFEIATTECKRSGIPFISPEHVLLATLNMPESTGRKLFERLGVDCEYLRSEALRRVTVDAEGLLPKKKRVTTSDKAEKETPKVLDEFCRNLCDDARANRIDPVIGREKVVTRLIQILGRRSKNNPILLGEPGVGKTAVAEGLAMAIVSQASLDGSPLPEFLQDKRVMQLDVGRLISGAKERGELENRVTKLMQEVKEANDVILMIDEIHTLVGAGSQGKGKGGGGGSGMDISNIIKPALARGDIQVIGATTIAEYRKHMERDPALERRFQPVTVEQPSEEQAVAILKGLREKYERHHRCAYSDEALQAAVRLSNKYIADRFLPDKAIDLMDEAGSRARIQSHNARRVHNVKESPMVVDFLQILEVKDEVVRDGLYEEAALLQSREDRLRQHAEASSSSASSPAIGAAAATVLPVVGKSDIESIVASWTGIPVESMSEQESTKLAHLASTLKKQLIGQNDAVDCISAALQRARCGLSDPNRPIASLLFVGPTGVGKTELAKVLAEQYFGNQEALIRLDMSEYMERHSVSKLIGAPPGYIGFGEGGKLTEAVRRRPNCIVLLDEVEKAHPDVMNVLLQVMEDGRLTDSLGRTVSFKNALLVLTSNIGSRIIASSPGGEGLSRLGVSFTAGQAAAELAAANDEDGQSSDEPMSLPKRMAQARMRSMVMDEVKQFFKPELLNRFDETVVFQKLGRKDVASIAKLMLKETCERVMAQGFTALNIMPRLMDRIVSEGYSHEYGVRPLRQTIINHVDNNLSDMLLMGQLTRGSSISMDLDADGNVCVNPPVVTMGNDEAGLNNILLLPRGGIPRRKLEVQHQMA